MTYTFDRAVAELANRNTIAELFDLVRNTSAKVAILRMEAYCLFSVLYLSPGLLGRTSAVGWGE